MDMFKTFCAHVRNTYQNLFVGATDPCQYMCLVDPYITLTEISLFPEIIDQSHDILQTFAQLTCEAINSIRCIQTTINKLTLPANSGLPDSDKPFRTLLYDFEKDTPEDVWNRVYAYMYT